MRSKLKVSAAARNDLLKIGRYMEEKWGRRQRNHYLKQLDEAFNLITENPKIGLDSSHVLPGYRSYQQGSHIIFYKHTDAIEIIRILHKRMDAGRHLI